MFFQLQPVFCFGTTQELIDFRSEILSPKSTTNSDAFL